MALQHGSQRCIMRRTRYRNNPNPNTTQSGRTDKPSNTKSQAADLDQRPDEQGLSQKEPPATQEPAARGLPHKVEDLLLFSTF